VVVGIDQMGAHSQRRLDISVAHELRDVDGLDPRRDAQAGEVRLAATALEVVAESILTRIPNAAEKASSTRLRPWHQPPSRFVSSWAMFRDRMAAPTQSTGLIGGQRGWVKFWGCPVVVFPNDTIEPSESVGRGA
jgi:hypothetical protein